MEIFNFLWLIWDPTIKSLSKSLFGPPTWFCVVHPNLDPTLGVEGVYPSMWEVKVGSGLG